MTRQPRAAFAFRKLALGYPVGALQAQTRRPPPYRDGTFEFWDDGGLFGNHSGWSLADRSQLVQEQFDFRVDRV
jgi:hypothetical protein